MLLVAILANTKRCKKTEKKTEPLAHGYSFESTQRELSNEYQHDRLKIVFKNLCVFVLWPKVALASALEGSSADTGNLNYLGLVYLRFHVAHGRQKLWSQIIPYIHEFQ